MYKYLNLIIIVAVLIPVFSNADTVPLSPTDDAVVVQGYPTTNYGSDEYFTVGYHTSFDWANTMIKFDLTPYTGMTINDAKLRLYVYDSVGAFPTDEIRIARNDGVWDESTVTWNNKPWGPNVAISAPSSYDWWVIDVTSWVQGFVNGTYTNYGFQIYKNDYDNDSFAMHSKEYSSNHPELVIDYPSAVESASLGSIKATFK